jgi:DNA polymerase-3 subunit delta'
VIDPDTPIESTRARPGDEDRVHRVIRKGHVDDLQHRASLKPFEGRTQVFVIDGAESMQAPAANALLKTLEEPEAQVTLVLLTPAPGALPETILSRCQRIDLRPMPSEVIERHLVESAGADPLLAHAVALAAGGRPGWALAALADPTAMESRRQSLVRVLSVIVGSIEERFRYTRTLAATYRKDRGEAAGEMAVWLGLWRDVLLAQHGQGSAVANPDYLTEIEAIAKATPATGAVAAVRSVQATSDALAHNAQPSLAFDVMMLELPRVAPGVMPSLAGAEAGGPAPDTDDPPV